MVDEFKSSDTGLAECEYCSIPAAGVTLIRFSLGDFNFSPYRFHKHQALVTVIYLAFAIISNVLLLNLLIALMNNTFVDVFEEADAIWAVQRARHILLAERRLSTANRVRFRLGSQMEDGKYYFVYQVCQGES